MSSSSKSALPPEDAVARLLKEAGPRTRVSRERNERVRDAVHAEWLRSTRARKRRRIALRSIAALAATASLFLMARWSARENLLSPSAPAIAAGVLESVTGTVHMSGATGFRGDTIFTGSTLETTPSARAAVRLNSGSSLRLDVASRVLVESPGVFALERGAIYIDSGTGDTPLAIRTRLGTARDVGTQFEVRLRDGAMVVRVREGAVELDRGDEVYQAFAGDELRAQGDGTLDMASVDSDAPAWNWVALAAPPFELEGSSLAGFLAWVSREQGWTVHFEDPALQASAETILLEGPALDAGPFAALHTVLPACGLAHRVDNGQLWIIDNP